MHQMVDIDNPGSAGAALLNQKYNFHFDGVIFRFGIIQSSRVKSISIDGSTMFVVTKNTKYTFRKV